MRVACLTMAILNLASGGCQRWPPPGAAPESESMLTLRRIFSVPHLIVAAHTIFYFYARSKHPEWVDGQSLNAVSIAYFPSWLAVSIVDEFVNWPATAYDVIFFLVGAMQWYVIGTYVAYTAGRRSH